MTALEPRLRAQRELIRQAVLDPATARPGTEPEHQALTAELVDGVLARLVSLLPERAHAPVGFDGLHRTGTRYATAGVSHAQALFELQRTIIEVSRRWWGAARPSDVGVMLQFGQSLERDVEPMRAALSDGYCQALAASGTRSVSRRQMAESLLAGRPVSRRLVLAAGIDVAPYYLVLCTTVPPSHGSLDDAADRVGVPGVVLRKQDDLLYVLVPVSRRAAETPGDTSRAMFRRLEAALDCTVAGAAVGAVAALPVAAEEARVVLDIAVACDRRGAVLAGQVLVERALTGSRSAMVELADVVAALARWPHLPETLRSLYDHDLDRSRTADALHIARRTLTKRLDRIHQLTGIHPTSAHGVQTFLSALAADRLTTRDRTGADSTEVGLGAG